MEVNTKYDLEDKVWVVNNNKVEKQTVTGIVVFHTEYNIEIEYELNSVSNIYIPEHLLFKTKEELLKSL